MIYEEKKYSKGKEYLRKFIRVMADMQKWDASGGVSGGDSVYRKEIYGIPYEYKITVTDASGGASVRIETDDAGGREAIRRQFELLGKLIAFKERFYEVSKEIILNAICDMAEIQRGHDVFSDLDTSEAGFSVYDGGREKKYLFTVKNSGSGCLVTLETPDSPDETAAEHAFPLLESLLPRHSKTDAAKGDGENGPAKNTRENIKRAVSMIGVVCLVAFAGIFAAAPNFGATSGLRGGLSSVWALFAPAKTGAITRVVTDWRLQGPMTSDTISRHTVEIDRATGTVTHTYYTDFGEKITGSETFNISADVLGEFFDFLENRAKVQSWKDDYTIEMLDGYAWDMTVEGDGFVKRIKGNETPPMGGEIERRIQALAGFALKPPIF